MTNNKFKFIGTLCTSISSQNPVFYALDPNNY